MTLEQLSQLSDIIGVVLIVASLVYVALQVRQNTDAQLAASRQTSVAVDTTLIAAIIANPEAAANAVKPYSELSHAEREQVGMLIAGLVRTREYAWSQYGHGVMDKVTMDSYMGTLVRWINLGETGRHYWDLFAQEIDPAFVSYVDGLLNKAPRAVRT
jgi:hypothetical protein